MVDIKIVNSYISSLPIGTKTKTIDEYISKLIKNKESISYDRTLLINNTWLQRVFFYTNLSLIDDNRDKFLFVDKHKNVFSNWAHTDQLISKVNKVDFDFLFKYAKKYVQSDNIYTRRFGYVMFITHPIKKTCESKEILSLFHDEDELTLQMAEGWMLCELAIYNPQMVYDYLFLKPLTYKVVSKAISKIQDSFRVSDVWKLKFKLLRNLYK